MSTLSRQPAWPACCTTSATAPCASAAKLRTPKPEHASTSRQHERFFIFIPQNTIRHALPALVCHARFCEHRSMAGEKQKHRDDGEAIMAVFLDLENLAIGARNSQIADFEITKVLERLLVK